MSQSKSDNVLALNLLIAIFLWGGNNVGTQYIVRFWPPIWTGGTRFFCAGLLLLALLRWTNWLGKPAPIGGDFNRQLWLRGGLSLATYIVCFNWALRFTSASHVALYLGASPVWALLWEGRPARSWLTLQRYVAAILTMVGVLVLFWPALRNTGGSLIGELLGITVSVLWTFYGRQCRFLSARISGVELSAQTMWRAGLLLLPLGLIEVARNGLQWNLNVVGIQLYCIVAGGVVAFAIWNLALRRWPTSKVLLFNNLIPLSTATWAYFFAHDRITIRFGVAMALIVTGVILGQVNGRKLFPAPALSSAVKIE